MGYPFPRKLKPGSRNFAGRSDEGKKNQARGLLPPKTLASRQLFEADERSISGASRRLSEGHPSLQWRKGVADMARRGEGSSKKKALKRTVCIFHYLTSWL
jgi:hypothetical protein